jgi:hypothetical protein
LWTQFKGQLLPFWLDTLRIPDQKKHQQHRKRAIAMMETHERASQVLVLVAELEHSPSTPYEEAFLRISISGWMRRLWTLRKGVLGKRLHAKFSDNILTQSRVDRLLLELWSFRSMVQERPKRKLIGFVTETTPVDPAADETCRRCSAIMAAFIASRYRSSSRAEDDFLCLASLLGWGTL